MRDEGKESAECAMVDEEEEEGGGERRKEGNVGIEKDASLAAVVLGGRRRAMFGRSKPSNFPIPTDWLARSGQHGDGSTAATQCC